MARFQPPLDPASLVNHGERSVAQALAAQLGDDVLVYHGCPILERKRAESGREFLAEGEVDFIVVAPRRGVLVLEVKGGTITYSPEEGYRRAEAGGKIRSPFEQARENMHAVMKRIEEEAEFRGRPLPFTRGYAVVFPHCRVAGPLPADVQPETVVGVDELPRLGLRVGELFEVWRRRDGAGGLDAAGLKAVRAALEAALNLIPVAGARVAEQEEGLTRATAEQARVLECLRALTRVACHGGAGSGKTVLALAQARALARAGKRTLLVCYNRPLALWLEGQVAGEFGDGLTVCNFHSLCESVCRKAGEPFPVRKDDAHFWDYEAAACLQRAAGRLPEGERFEAVVVDEGQDFFRGWWAALGAVTRAGIEACPLWWFYDPRQNLRVPAEEAGVPPGLMGPVVLTRNCRNTRRIARRCGEILHEEVAVLETLPEGDAIREVTAGGVREVVRAARQQVREWLDAGRLRPRQVAILTAGRPGEEWPDTIGFWPLANDCERWRRDGCILLSPHRRFKGLEADAVVLAGVPEPGSSPYFTAADYYVACSRAKHLLTVIRRQG